MRALERDGPVGRTVYAAVPTKAEYRLTDPGRSLLEFNAAVKDRAEIRRHDAGCTGAPKPDRNQSASPSRVPLVSLTTAATNTADSMAKTA
ncbi:winged helix-turn-helix transcriptional regulator [Streptomyces sp. SAI-229]|uniref:winged helix-turn-helix transcriptional regulator n=1 Tax=Streptomyces sp. SAI-229 TaxID=3377731 RepID=UPI003C7D1475